MPSHGGFPYTWELEETKPVYVLVWVVDPITKWRHAELKLAKDVTAADERVKL